MTVLELAQAIGNRVRKELVENLGYTVYVDNEKTEESAFAASEELKPFVLSTTLFNERTQMHVGETSGERQTGILMLSIFVESGDGDGEALRMADSCMNAFRRVTDSGVTFRTPSPKVLGRNRFGWYQVNVECPFYSDSNT